MNISPLNAPDPQRKSLKDDTGRQTTMEAAGRHITFDAREVREVTSAVSAMSQGGGTVDDNRKAASPGAFLKMVSTLKNSAAEERKADRTGGIGALAGARIYSTLLVRAASALHDSGAPISGSKDVATLLGQALSGPLMASGQQGQSLLLSELQSAVSAWTSAIHASLSSTSPDRSGLRSAMPPAALPPSSAPSPVVLEHLTEGTQAAAASGARILGLAGAIYSGYQLFENFGNTNFLTGALNGAALGTYLGSIVPGGGTFVGGVAGGTLGGASALFKRSGKHEDQVVRDQLRRVLQQLGLLDSQFSLKLADGGRYDLGKDGGARLRNTDGTTRRTYDTDPLNPLSSVALSMLNPLARLIAGSSVKRQSDLAGMLANAAISNARSPEEVRQNVLSMTEAMHLDEGKLKTFLEYAAANQLVTKEEAEYFRNGLSLLFRPASARVAQE